MVLDKEDVYTYSTKQNFNPEISIETEFVRVDNMIPQIIWTGSFLKSQGFIATNNIIYQDNQKKMSMQKKDTCPMVIERVA